MLASCSEILRQLYSTLPGLVKCHRWDWRSDLIGHFLSIAVAKASADQVSLGAGQEQVK